MGLRILTLTQGPKNRTSAMFYTHIERRLGSGGQAFLRKLESHAKASVQMALFG